MCSKPPLLEADETDSDEIDPELEEDVDEIFDIALWENTGEKTQWEIYPFEYKLLYFYLRKAEQTIKAIYEGRMQSFLKGWMTGDKD
jgi:hypothetical protein